MEWEVLALVILVMSVGLLGVGIIVAWAFLCVRFFSNHLIGVSVYLLGVLLSIGYALYLILTI